MRKRRFFKKAHALVAGLVAVVSGMLLTPGAHAQQAQISISLDFGSLRAESSEYFEEVSNKGYFIGMSWEDNLRGVLIVLEPPGALVEIYRGRYRKLRDHAPTAFYISSSDQYEIVITLPDNRVWRKTFSLKPGMKYLLGVYPEGFPGSETAGASANATVNVNVTDVNSQSQQQQSSELVAVHTHEHEHEPESPPCPAMDADKFADLITQMQGEPFSDDRLDILKLAAKNYCFSIGQAKRIARLFDFDDDRLKAMKIVYPKLVNKDDVYQLYDVFTFSSTKEEFKEWVEMQED